MKALFPTLVLAGACMCAESALASIPTLDAAQLTQHADTASTKVKLVPVTTQRQDANNGVKCAVTTGKKGNVTDPTVQPLAGAGSRSIQSYAPDMPATPAPDARGATLNSQTLFKSTGDVAAGLDANGSTLRSAQSGFSTASQQVGTSTTVMAALDMNSSARLQNNLAWNGSIGSANLWVTTLNALNLALTSDMSRAALGMRSSSSASDAPASPVCPIGMVGSGTTTDPCRASTSCSTTPPGTPVDPACVIGRAIDSAGSVLFYLGAVQDAAQAALPVSPSTTPSPPASSGALSAADVAAALASIQSSAR